jgi:hypothetical protein
MKQTTVEWLQEQLKDVNYNPLEKNGYSNALERLYEQAKEMEKQKKDEFAIGFAEWLVSNCYCEDDHWWLIKVSGDVIKTSKELLEIYKKEKGL